MGQPKASRNALNDWLRALQYKKQLDSSEYTTLFSVIADVARTHGDRIALTDESEQFTYRALIERSGRYAAWALQQGLAAGEVVGLLMPNCPTYVAIWLGLTQVGCTVALINTNLVGDAIAHSLRVAGSRHIIVAASLLKSVTAIEPQLPEGTSVWVHGDADTEGCLKIDIETIAADTPPPALCSQRQHDRALLIYTSGTTGLPKAANISHARMLEWSFWFAAMMDAKPEDRLYNCLPLYHSTGGVVAIGAMLTQGGCVVIRPRFSTGRFWDDVVREQCTIFQYIGELCRYLVQGPPHPLETSHRLRLCCGNGLSGEVWERFAERFQIPRILEFYAATEGNVSLYNCEGKPGAIGRIPPFLLHRFPIELIKIDIDSGEPLRDEAGHCLRCAPNEPGEAIGQILPTSASPARHFDGYTDREASARKVLRDVFVPGDRWFRTGDLMRRDEAGYFYFIDRIGDTFRWKGENVSTTEVAAAIATCPGVVDAVVYGVAIPGMEGRVGMAAVKPDENFNLATFREHMVASLPTYARPAFLRICDDIEMTGTFKLKKTVLAREGLLVCSTDTTVWFDDRKSGMFVKCDMALISNILNGSSRLL